MIEQRIKRYTWSTVCMYRVILNGLDGHPVGAMIMYSNECDIQYYHERKKP